MNRTRAITASAPARRTCGSGRVVPVVCGVPSAVLAPLFMTGRIEAGGPVGRLAGRCGAHWACCACGSRWRDGMFGGGSGDSPAEPVVISGIGEHAVRIRAEYMHLAERFGLPAGLACGGAAGWRVTEQAAALSGDGVLDMPAVESGGGGSRIVFFRLPGPGQPGVAGKRLPVPEPPARPGNASGG
jgi:hypothetical protein